MGTWRPPTMSTHIDNRLLEHQLLSNARVQELLARQDSANQVADTPTAPAIPPATWSDAETISRALGWTTAPGYIQPATRYTSVTASSVGNFDQEELRFLQVYPSDASSLFLTIGPLILKAHGAGNTQHHRRRDEFSTIAEVTLRAPHLKK